MPTDLQVLLSSVLLSLPPAHVKVWALFGRPQFLRSFHGWATVIWLIVSVPLAIAYGDAVVFVTFLSLYAVVTGHWSSWQAARVEVRQDEQL